MRIIQRLRDQERQTKRRKWPLFMIVYLILLLGSQLTAPTQASFTYSTTSQGNMTAAGDFGEEPEAESAMKMEKPSESMDEEEEADQSIQDTIVNEKISTKTPLPQEEVQDSSGNQLETEIEEQLAEEALKEEESDEIEEPNIDTQGEQAADVKKAEPAEESE